MDDVAGDQLGGVDHILLAVPDDSGMGSRQIFQRLQSLFRLALLHDAHNGIEYDNQQDQHRLKEFLGLSLDAGNGKGNSCRRQQDQDHHILELGQKALEV